MGKKSFFKKICRIVSIVAAIVTFFGFAAAVIDVIKQKYTLAQLKVESYKLFFKRMLDFICAAAALIVFSPLYLLLTVTGAIVMRGNPFFIQKRPGRHEKIFKLIKFRSMSSRKDADGNLLPDEQRLGGYGRFIREFSLDELPEAVNILKGDMSVVGPRPQLVRDMVFMTEQQRKRHHVRPGLSGLAQVRGRNALAWNAKLCTDLEYVQNISFLLDVKIIFETVKQVVFRQKAPEIESVDEIAMTDDFGDYLLKIGAISPDTYRAGQEAAARLLDECRTEDHRMKLL